MIIKEKAEKPFDTKKAQKLKHNTLGHIDNNQNCKHKQKHFKIY